MDNKPGKEQPLDREPEETTKQADPSDTTSGQTAPAKPKQPWSKKKKIIVWGAGIFLAVLGAAGLWLLLQPGNEQPNPVKQTQQTTQSTTQTTASLTLLTKPQKLADLALFKDLKEFFGEYTDGGNKFQSVTKEDVNYYQVGATKDGEKIIVIHISAVANTSQQILIEKDGQYKLLLDKAAYTTEEFLQQEASRYENGLIDSVSVVTDMAIPEIQFPKEIQTDYIAGTRETSFGSYGAILPDGLKSLPLNKPQGQELQNGAQPKKIGQTGGYSVYRITAKDNDANFTVEQLQATTGETFTYSYQPIINGIPLNGNQSEPEPAITWTSGSKDVKAHYSGGVIGCGFSYGYVVAKNLKSSSLQQVGISPTGKPLYSIAPSAPIFNEFYGEYKNNADLLNDTTPKNYTKDEYQAAHALIATKISDNGDYAVFVRSGFLPVGGCGKPVVYLYPTRTTTVNVRVGADVKISNPYYNPRTGWQRVTAQPSGALTYQGKHYDSLYWEGYGHGEYPIITSGIVVKQGDAVATIKRQLQEQGFNQKETSDFLDFWQSRLPNTPYIRLTWFTTGQMNQLAPLAISPRPQTMIRTFLDFEGLEKPAVLSPQQFKAPVRNGFTVVEWGGLLREGLGD
ncbi:MAG: hypothetical protein WBP26_03515 [Candidatus Saccharimonadales bacterium]